LGLKIRAENAGLGFRRDVARITVKSDTKLQLNNLKAFRLHIDLRVLRKFVCLRKLGYAV
jgi:hypothetical protein